MNEDIGNIFHYNGTISFHNLVRWYYRVISGAGGTDYSGSVLDTAASGMATGSTASCTFTFPETDADGAIIPMVHKVDEYYMNYVDIHVVKIVDDSRSTPTSVAGWSMNLTSSADTSYSATLSTVLVDGGKGEAVFTHLKKTDETGAYIAYTAEELGVDSSIWTVTYAPSTSAVTVTSAATREITVTNRFRRSTVNITKVDRDDNTVVLEGAKYKLYTMIEGVKNYVTANLDENGLHVLSATESSAQEFVTDTNGVATVDNLPSGYTWYAHETAAPENYYLATEDVEIGLADVNPLNKTISDNKKPTITVAKGPVQSKRH